MEKTLQISQSGKTYNAKSANPKCTLEGTLTVADLEGGVRGIRPPPPPPPKIRKATLIKQFNK
jgi:hypothetical protein